MDIAAADVELAKLGGIVSWALEVASLKKSIGGGLISAYLSGKPDESCRKQKLRCSGPLTNKIQ